MSDPLGLNSDADWLASRFQEARPRLKALAGRILGSPAEAEDAVQEAWLRLARTDALAIENLGAWLTTVVSRVCLDQLRRRKSRGEEFLDEPDLDAAGPAPAMDPLSESILTDSVEQALLVVLDRLSPPERVALVLHDFFDLPFPEIARILRRSEEGVRKLASRARRHVQAAREAGAAGVRSKGELVSAFLAASRRGDFSALLQLLDATAVLRADSAAVQTATANAGNRAPRLAPELRGAEAVAGAFKGRSHGAVPALLDGEPGGVWVHRGKTLAAFLFETAGDRILGLRIAMEPATLAAMTIKR